MEALGLEGGDRQGGRVLVGVVQGESVFVGVDDVDDWGVGSLWDCLRKVLESMQGLGGGGRERSERELPPRSAYTGSSEGGGGGGKESKLNVL